MIGFQCAPSAQQVAGSLANQRGQQAQQVTGDNHQQNQIVRQATTTISDNKQPSSSTPTSSTSSSPIDGEQQQQQEQSEAQIKTSRSSSLAGHIRSLINAGSKQQQQQQQQQHSNTSAGSPVSQHTQLMQSSSPGYQSPASSPSSSAASPVSSTNSSSGVSTASSSASSTSSSSASTTSPAAPVSHHSSSSGPSSTQSTSVSPSSASRSPISPSLLDYYPELNQDGLGLSWFHETNNRALLSAALSSNKMVVSGEISLAEMSRYPVPIMAKPPLGISDITLENWLQEVVASPSQKGIKLTFTSTRTVEPAFRVLARHAENLKGPMILNADILACPTSNSNGSLSQSGRANRMQQQQQQNSAQNNPQQPVDAWTFLMLCRTRFPKSIISIGWCTPQHQSAVVTSQHLTEPISLAGPMISVDNSSPFHSSAESMFDLDIMDTSQSLGNASTAAAAAAAGQLQHLGYQNHQHLHPNQHQHHQHHQHHHHSLHQRLQANPYPLISHHRHNNNLMNHHLSSHLNNHRTQHHHHQQQNNHHLTHNILSSTGSLNSSSGNSSGSPSPTSPVSHLMSPPHQTVATNLSLSLGSTTSGADSGPANRKSPAAHRLMADSSDASKGSGHAAAAAAAAMAAAVMAATSSFHHQHDLNNQQLPLNLNINEADQQLSSSSLSQLAQKIQSYQTINNQQQHHLNHNHNYHNQKNGNSNNLMQHLHHQDATITNNHELSSTSSPSPSVQHQQLSSKLFNSHLHVTKKTALCDGNSNNPSPRSSIPSPKQHLLLKTTNGGTSAVVQQQQNQLGGYTREMIDKMASLVKEYNLTQPVTFPVEARWLKNSLGELQRLLYQVGSNSTLTVVAQQDDLIGVDDLLTIRRAFATNQILFDLPDELATAFKQELDLM